MTHCAMTSGVLPKMGVVIFNLTAQLPSYSAFSDTYHCVTEWYVFGRA